MEATHYHWSPAGSANSVKLSFDVLDQILQEVLRGFGAVPKRGAEVGGILLGRFNGHHCVVVDGFQAVPCDYKLGPGYDFTDEDRLRFHEIAGSLRKQMGLVPVGCYRSHTSDGLAPTTGDLERLVENFSDQRAALLLIKPYATKISQGAFFFRDNGKLPSLTKEEFPFSRKLLGGGARPPRREEEAAAIAPAPPRPPEVLPPAAIAPDVVIPPVPVELREIPTTPIVERRGRRGVWAAALTLAVALGWAGGYLTYRFLPRPTDPSAFAVQLKVSAKSSDLEVIWDASAPAIRTATRGSIRIKNDAGEKTVRLDLDQLRQGRAIVREGASTSTLVDLDIEQIAGSMVKESAAYAPRITP